MMNTEAELLLALRSNSRDPTSLSAWVDLFLQLAEPRILALREVVTAWQDDLEQPLPFSALRLVDDLAGLCAEQTSASLRLLSAALANALLLYNGQICTAQQAQAALKACDEMWRQLHQHAAGIQVLTPREILRNLV